MVVGAFVLGFGIGFFAMAVLAACKQRPDPSSGDRLQMNVKEEKKTP